LIIRGGVTRDFKAIGALCTNDCVFTDSFLVIKHRDNIYSKDMKSILALINSKFFQYLVLMLGSSIGIERENTIDDDFLSLPLCSSSYLETEVDKIERLIKLIYDNWGYIPLKMESNGSLIDALNSVQDNIYNAIKEGLQIDDMEQSLIDYALEYTIPSLAYRDKYYINNLERMEMCDEILNIYMTIFLSKFNDVLKDMQKALSAEIHYSNYVIYVIYRLQDITNGSNNHLVWIESNNDELVSTFINLGVEQISERLFISKDIRGFEKRSFYIAKPNEKRLWHRSRAYYDFYEFYNALLIAGRDNLE
jgi:hypothetical protein